MAEEREYAGPRFGRFVSKAQLARSARKRARAAGKIGAMVAEEGGEMPKVYRSVSEANPSLSHNEVRRISNEANRRSHQGSSYGLKGDPLKRAAGAKRKALKLGYKANEALRGGAGVTKDTVGALRRAVIGMGKFAAKGASAGMPGELMEPVAKDADKTAKEIRSRLKKRDLERRTKVAKIRAGVP